MKKFFIAFLFVFSALFGTSALADDPCETCTCMYGKLVGKGGGSACNSAIAKYFSIIVYKKKKINWGATSNARLDYLNSCKGSDKNFNQAINAVYGGAAG